MILLCDDRHRYPPLPAHPLSCLHPSLVACRPWPLCECFYTATATAAILYVLQKSTVLAQPKHS